MEKIRPVGHIKITRESKSHISELIRREVGVESPGAIPFVINASTVLLYNPTMTLKEILASIDVLRQDVQLRLQKPALGGKQ